MLFAVPTELKIAKHLVLLDELPRQLDGRAGS